MEKGLNGRIDALLKIAEASRTLAEDIAKARSGDDAQALKMLAANITAFSTIARKVMDEDGSEPWRMKLVSTLLRMLDIDIINFWTRIKCRDFALSALLPDVAQSGCAIEFATKRLEENREIHMAVCC